MGLDLTGSPYSLEETGQGVLDDVGALRDRIELLRHEGTPTDVGASGRRGRNDACD